MKWVVSLLLKIKSDPRHVATPNVIDHRHSPTDPKFLSHTITT